MATEIAPGDVAPPRLRRAGTGAFERASGEVSATMRRRRYSGLLSDHFGAVFSSPAPPGQAGAEQTAGGDDAQEPAPIAAGSVIARSINERRVLASNWRRYQAGRRRARGHLQRKGLFRSDGSDGEAERRADCDFAAGAILSLPAAFIATVARGILESEEIFWVQEEPQNMGGWSFMRPRLEALLRKGQELRYVGRTASASPAIGSYTIHQLEQAQVMKEAFG